MSQNAAGAVHGEHHHDAQAHGTVRGYLIGFLVSVVLTAVPFWMAITGPGVSPQLFGLVVMGFAAIQVIVHMIFFLHMNGRSEGGWNMIALIFTLIICVIMLAGSLWVMFHLNTNMMPMSDGMAGNR
ncbi:cytochrome o ubiquinol oxidase subunit IV [Mesorhizobium sp. SB112]|uniref:cytochrome o ubiquinol oxidase subunit IV n=1 Tax=Mesorhizobium sp. SB112 TaxID=3151853 RepID=UPI003264D653